VTEGSRYAEISYLTYNELIEKSVIALGWGIINDGSLPRILHLSTLQVRTEAYCEAKVQELNHQLLRLDDNLICTSTSLFSLLMKVSMCFALHISQILEYYSNEILHITSEISRILS
jgi:hypothetical protein